MSHLIVFDGILRRCDEIIKDADAMLAREKEMNEEGKISWFNPEALIRDAKLIKEHLEAKKPA
jgi:hypothetical protein